MVPVPQFETLSGSKAEGDGVFEKDQLELVTTIRDFYHGFAAVGIIVELRGGIDHWGFPWVDSSGGVWICQELSGISQGDVGALDDDNTALLYCGLVWHPFR